jgi:hypothetical protein
MRSVHYLALACLIGSAMPAYCQSAPAIDKIKIEVTRAELQMIGQGLMELPYKTVAPVLNDLQAQLNAADAAVKAAADAAKPKAEEKPEEKAADAPAK